MKNSEHSIGLVVEGPDDDRTVRHLCESLFGLDSDDFVGIAEGTPCAYWRNVDHEARERRIPRRHGNFGDEPGVEDARMAVLALRCFISRADCPTAVVLVRDSDGKRDERCKGLNQARADGVWPFNIMIGIPHPMRECWVLTAFCPQSKAEKTALAGLKKNLGFDPLRHSERLTAKQATAKKSAKWVLARLLEADSRIDSAEREWQCWENADVESLNLSGHENGLAEFIAELKAHLTQS